MDDSIKDLLYKETKFRKFLTLTKSLPIITNYDKKLYLKCGGRGENKRC
jgi:hypothetical protein